VNAVLKLEVLLDIVVPTGRPLQYHEVAPVEVLLKLTISGGQPVVGEAVKLAVCPYDGAMPTSRKHSKKQERKDKAIGMPSSKKQNDILLPSRKIQNQLINLMTHTQRYAP